jgi:ATP-dependent Clp protease adaptor protein ClpS
MNNETIVLPKTTTTTDLELVVVSDEELARPYRVMIENDDVTPMEFVVFVLLMIFELDAERAQEIMLTAHYEGEAYVVTLPYEEAKARVYRAHTLARQNNYPLSFYLEQEA